MEYKFNLTIDVDSDFLKDEEEIRKFIRKNLRDYACIHSIRLKSINNTTAQNKVMTKAQFKRSWNSNKEITYDDIANCAKAWGLYYNPRISDINEVTEAVVHAAGCKFDNE